MKTYLAEYLHYRNITPQELGESTKVSPKVIAKYVAGTTTPSLEVAGILCNALNITIDDLVHVHPKDHRRMGISLYVTTSSFVEAIRLQNYLLETNCAPTLEGHQNGDSEIGTFVIRYARPIPLTIKEIRKITKSKKYADNRELMDPDENVPGLNIIHF